MSIFGKEIPVEENTKRRSRWRTVIEWVILGALVLFLTQTTPGTMVRSWLQRGLLWTGVFKPNTEQIETKDASSVYALAVSHLDGTRASLSELRGKVVFLNVWATWCSPCLAEMPLIQDLYEVLDENASGDRIAFVMLSVDETRETAARFIQKRAYSFPVYHTSSRLPEPFTSSMIPSTYVIAPNGDLAMAHSGMANYRSDAFREFLLNLASDVAVAE